MDVDLKNALNRLLAVCDAIDAGKGAKTWSIKSNVTRDMAVDGYRFYLSVNKL